MLAAPHPSQQLHFGSGQTSRSLGNSKHKIILIIWSEVLWQLRSQISFTKISLLGMKAHKNCFTSETGWFDVGMSYVYVLFHRGAIPVPYCLPCRKKWTGLQRLQEAPPRNFPGSCFAVTGYVPTRRGSGGVKWCGLIRTCLWGLKKSELTCLYMGYKFLN